MRETQPVAITGGVAAVRNEMTQPSIGSSATSVTFAEKGRVEAEGVSLTFETITPALAESMLKNLGRMENRAIRPGRLEMYASDMSAGQWQQSGVPIIFDAEGGLIDGQHRLAAVVRSGITQVFAVSRGVPRENVTTLDAGARRRLADALKMRGDQYYNDIPALLGHVWRWEHTGSFARTGVGTASEPTITQALEFFDAHKDDFYEAIVVGFRARGHTRISGTVAAAVYYVIHNVVRGDEAGELDLATFFDRLCDGVGLMEGDPILALRNRLSKAASVATYAPKQQPVSIAAWVIKAWNFWRDGTTITQLIWRTGGANPETFPIAR